MSLSHIWRKLRFFLFLGSMSILIGCSGWQPLEGNSTAGEIPDGPGIFSGEDGKFVIYTQEKKEE
jgi:hypothetical protein